MKPLKFLLPGNTPSSLAGQSEYIVLRERILQSIMIGASVLSFALYVVLMRTAFPGRHWGDVAFFTVMTGLVLTLTAARNLPYGLRAGSLLLVVYGTAVYSLAQSGLSGHGQLLILTFTIMTGILVNRRVGIISFLFTLVTFAAFGAGMTGGLIPVPPLGLNGDSASQSDWLQSGFFYLLVAGLTTIPLSALVSGLQASLKKQQEYQRHLEIERSNLEQNVQKRTDDLERRLSQIRTAAEISRTISLVLDPQVLLQNVADLLVERMKLYYTGVFLLDDSGHYAVLRAGSGEAGSKMLAAGHRLASGGNSMIGSACSSSKARIALDVGEEPVRFNNPYLPLTRSELAIPIIGREKTIGALSIQSTVPNAFDENDILVFQGIADSLAIALENGRLLQQSLRDLEEIRSLNRKYLEQSWSDAVDILGGLSYTYENPMQHSHLSGASGLQVPLMLRDQIIGQIALETGMLELSEEDRAVVEAISTQTALALENARLLEETQRRAAQEEKINQLTAKFSSAQTIEEILKTAIQELALLPAVAEVAVHLMPAAKETGSQPARSNGKEHVE